MELKELKEKGKTVLDEANKLYSEKNGKFEDADKEKYENLLKQADDYASQITKIEKEEEYKKAFSLDNQSNKEENKMNEIEQFSEYLKTGNAEKYAGTVDAAPFAPEVWVNKLYETTQSVGNILSKVTIDRMNITAGNYPVVTTDFDDASWTAELTETSADATGVIGTKTITSNVLRKVITVSKRAIDLGVNVESKVLDKLSKIIGKTIDKAILTGTGANEQPLGVFVASADGVSTASDVAVDNYAAFTPDVILKVIASLLAQGYQKTDLTAVMHPDIFTTLITSKASTAGNYMVEWKEFNTFAGVPVILSNLAPSATTAGKYIAVIGDFKSYNMILSNSVQINVDASFKKGSYDYVAEIYGGGAPIVGGNFRRIKLTA